MSRIYLSAPDVTAAEEVAVMRALKSGWVAPLGPEVDAFEEELAAFTGRAHAVALSSGTAALHLGLLELGVTPGSVVITSTMTFAATANVISYTGATPVFVDSDETGNIDPHLLAEALADQRVQGRPVAAVLPVDLIGKIADHDAVRRLADEHGLPVLADAAESLGAQRNGRRAGADGNAAAVSFNGNKVMTTSGGGALLCDDEELAHRVRYLAAQARQPVAHYEHTEVGYNYRLSNLLAALGRAQLGRLPAMIERRREWRRRYRKLFEGASGVTIFGGADGVDAVGPGADHDNFWLTSIVVDRGEAGWSSEELRRYLEAADIEARPLWKPMHRQPAFARHPAYVNGTSERLFGTGLSLPSGSSLTHDQFELIEWTLETFLRRKTT